MTDRTPNDQTPNDRSLCVVGLGLIGGSLLRAAERAGWAVQGTATSTADVAAARAAGHQVTTAIDDALRAAADRDALITLAVPLTAVDDVLAVVRRCAPHSRLSDVVSVKEPVAQAVARLTPQARYVGGHPMAGTAESGWAAGSAELFTDASWVVSTADDTDVEVWAQVAALALDCGAHVVPATAAEHDAAVARISHLPHLLAAVLASVGADGGPLALALGAGSFTDGTRVAGAPPDLIRSMCEGNRSALLDALDDALGRLGVARGALASTGSLQATIRAGHLARRALDAARAKGSDPGPGGTVQIDLTDAGAPERLLEIGRVGGRVVALNGTRCRCTC